MVSAEKRLVALKERARAVVTRYSPAAEKFVFTIGRTVARGTVTTGGNLRRPGTARGKTHSLRTGRRSVSKPLTENGT
ncbi:hypothetical protein Q669_19035 [Labrenzia sp. C1B10]|nr:hypothetical protein Q669_19035 [Labrenzia sp. C1B10]ERP99908.1 hypothetical protein Q675_10110 [Labrenzia sp. C1B70]